jgi:hypothetical protein
MEPSPVSGAYGEAMVGAGSHLYVARCTSAGAVPRFLRYDPAADLWADQSVAGLPTGAFRNGTALAWDRGDWIYALLGARYSDPQRRLFFRYHLLTDTWEQLADSPEDQGAGDAMTWSGYDGAVWAILGSSDSSHGNALARYHDGAWSVRTLNPSWSDTDDGASLTWAGGAYLYAARGESHETSPNTEYARYHIPTDSWEALSSVPAAVGVGDGGSAVWMGEMVGWPTDRIYLLSGGGAGQQPGTDFHRYDTTLDNWETLEPIPCEVGEYNGNRLGAAAGRLFCWQGAPGTWACGGSALYAWESYGPTIQAFFTCRPSTGTVPLTTSMSVGLLGAYAGQTRRVAARIIVDLAGGLHVDPWRAGYTNIQPGGSYNSTWSQSIPALSSVIGDNLFTLVAEDVTPAPYNQPPYPPAGDTAVVVCTVTGIAP